MVMFGIRTIAMSLAVTLALSNTVVAVDSDYTAATGYVTMNKSDDTSGTTSSFNSAGNWSDKKEPHSDTNYYVRSGQRFTIPDANATFDGRNIVIAGTAYQIATGGKTIKWSDVEFLPGSQYRILQIAPIRSNESTGFTISGSESAPFKFFSTRGESIFSLYTNFSSEEDGYMRFSNEGSGMHTYYFRVGSSWSGFCGYAEVGGGCSIRADDARSVSTPGFVTVKGGGRYELFGTKTCPEIGVLNVESGGELCPTNAQKASYFSITKQLNMAEGVRVVCSNTFNALSTAMQTCGVFRLSADAVAAGIPDLSKVDFMHPGKVGRLPRFKPVVYDDPDVAGGKYVGWSRHPVIRMKKQNQGSSLALHPATGESLTDYWDDGKLPHEGADYRIDQNFFISGAGNPYTFPGDSCTVKHGRCFGLRNDMRTLTFNDLSFVDGVILRPLQVAAYVLNGRLSLLKGDNAFSPALVNCANAPTQSLTINSEIDGDNDIVFRLFTVETAGYSSAKGEVYLTGFNTNYTGRIIVTAVSDEYTLADGSTLELGADNTLTLHITDARNLGGALAQIDADSLVLSNKCRLAIDATTKFSEINRGWHIPEDAYLRVKTSAMVTCANTLTIGGELVKEGAGTLCLAAKPVSEGSSARLTVSAGNLAVAATDALEGLPTTLASGSTLIIDRESGDAAFKEKGLVLTDVSIVSESGVVPVSFTFDVEKIDTTLTRHSFSVMTYPAAQSSAVASAYRFSKPSEARGTGYSLELEERDNGDGTLTLNACLVRKGLRISVR